MTKAARHLTTDKVRVNFLGVDVSACSYNEKAYQEFKNVVEFFSSTIFPFWEKLAASSDLKAEDILAIELNV